ncbi:hypothetical protein AAY473_027706 [Plecturocebus cupreus]
MAQFRLIATSASRVQVILLPQLPEYLGLQRRGFTMLARLVSNSCPPVIHPPPSPKVLGSQAFSLLLYLHQSFSSFKNLHRPCISQGPGKKQLTHQKGV